MCWTCGLDTEYANNVEVRRSTFALPMTLWRALSTKMKPTPFLEQLSERVNGFGLELAKEKTRCIEFGRFARNTAYRRGEKPKEFTFLGFSVSSEGWHVQWETVPSG